ncbi:MAG: hypothetical protein KGL39_51520 [Patescibacteria group bacterium]|nr:hypothetical protein [Patescibacteria group bacterium]
MRERIGLWLYTQAHKLNPLLAVAQQQHISDRIADAIHDGRYIHVPNDAHALIVSDQLLAQAADWTTLDGIEIKAATQTDSLTADIFTRRTAQHQALLQHQAVVAALASRQ